MAAPANEQGAPVAHSKLSVCVCAADDQFSSQRVGEFLYLYVCVQASLVLVLVLVAAGDI